MKRYEEFKENVQSLLSLCGSNVVELKHSNMPRVIPNGATCKLKSVKPTELAEGDLILIEGDHPVVRRVLGREGNKLVTTVDWTGHVYQNQQPWVSKIKEVKVNGKIKESSSLLDILGRFTGYGARQPFQGLFRAS